MSQQRACLYFLVALTTCTLSACAQEPNESGMPDRSQTQFTKAPPPDHILVSPEPRKETQFSITPPQDVESGSTPHLLDQ